MGDVGIMLRLDYVNIISGLSKCVLHFARSQACKQGNFVPSILSNPDTSVFLSDAACLSRHNFRQLIYNAKIFFVNIILMLDVINIRR